MSKAAHTAGPVAVIKGAVEGDDMRCAVAVQRGKVQYLLATVENGAPGDFCETEEANAALIAEAFNVATETGMTPRQLAEAWKRDLGLYDEVIAQRAELLAALDNIISIARTDFGPACAARMEDVARTARAKATGVA